MMKLISHSRFRILAGGVFLVAAGWFAWSLSSDVLVKSLPGFWSSHEERLFCAGVDEETGQEKSVLYTVTKNGQQARLRFYAKKQGAAGLGVLAHEDERGAISQQAPQSHPDRVSFRLSETEHLQVYRECGQQPICRVERIQHQSAAEIQRAREQLTALERSAYEARKRSAELAEKYASLRAQVEDGERRLAELKQKRNRGLASEAEQALRAVKAQAEVAISDLHSSTAATDSIHRQLQSVQTSAESGGARAKMILLRPSRHEEWCRQ
ncbi:MAG: hypothetical protein NDI61_13685 [Bdellovibrionaceae bacterium]|nr:hypothetical protein [Pseudobdellovibrionaceae bacterium]